KGMYLVVNSSSGTGRRAANEAISMAGKTGSAQVLTPDDRHTNAWFIGYAPADEPRYAFAVLVEYADSGGQDAAPLAGEFFERWLESRAK
ncbi:MAG: penicillin-binding transpeptidase domain-containing protein, partial [Lentisphaeria bacterium]